MASQVIHYPGDDLAILTWTGPFDIDECRQAFSVYLLKPAAADIIDIRRLYVTTIRAMDLFQLSRLLRSISMSGTYTPGKTAVVAPNGETLAASAVYRECCHLIAWAEANQVTRKLGLFHTIEAARDWLGVRSISERSLV